MNTTDSHTKPRRRPAPWRAVALPAEHGSWGLVLEPLLLGLLAAPSAAGAALALTAFAAFLLRQPARALLTAARRGQATARTAYARRFALIYGGVMLFGAGLTAWLLTRPGAPGLAPLWPLLLALPSALIFAWSEWRSQPRHWLAEAGGAAAFAPLPAVMALLAGRPALVALGLAAAVLARAWPSIAYIRARIRLEKGAAAGRQRDQLFSAGLSTLGLLTVAGFGAAGAFAWPASLAYVILLLRALEGLRAGRKRLAIRTIGFMEIGLGLLMVVLVAAGVIINN